MLWRQGRRGVRATIRQVSSSSARPIGFFGLGNMGAAMAYNLVKNGKELVVFDKNPNSPGVQELVATGKAKAGLSVAEVVKECDIIMSMVPAAAHVKDLYLSEEGLINSIASMAPDDRTHQRLLMDSSTIDPASAREVIAAARDKGLRMLDTPVSGAVTAAKAGSLTFMVGTDFVEEVAMVEPILLCMGKAVVHTGGPGTGAVAKVCNNLILGATMLGVAEGYRLAQKLGLDLKTFHDIVATSSGRSWSSHNYNPVPGMMENVPAERDYANGFQVDLIAKDLSLALQAAASCGTSVPVSEFSKAQYEKVSEKGHGNLDFSSVFKYHVED